MTPVLFAKDLMTTEHRIHSSPAFSPDLTEVYWSVFPGTDQFSTRTQVILYSTCVDGQCIPPRVASFSGEFFDGGPVFSADGKRLYFYSRRPLDGNSKNETEGEIWYVDRSEDGWSQPRHLSIDMKCEKLFFSLAGNGNLYFTSGHGPRGRGSGNVDIYRATYTSDSFSAPERLPAPVNLREYLESDVLIAPDESWLIFYSFERPGNVGQYDLYVSFRTGDRWSVPQNLGESINQGYSRFPGLSPDGKYLFFVRRDGIYWVSIEILNDLSGGN
ncbi:MAG: PD40 domain-containing protein [Deltaproteobacteria bacterium]|nr:PD40 domain-containing protein [Deltaproteobacteria bacterium]